MLTQLMQQPPAELLAATQAEGEDGTQAEIWEVRLPASAAHEAAVSAVS